MTLTTFISYKSQHREFALRVYDALDSWGHRTWIDVKNIAKGEYFRGEIQKGLESAQVVVGVVTPEALASREVLTEWDYAFSKGRRLLLLRYQSADLPYWLSGIQYIDFTVDPAKGFEQLREALASEDTSRVLGEAPAEITRHQDVPSMPAFEKPPKAEKRRPERPRRDKDEANRQQMLLNVYDAWIEGVLEKNLEAGAFDLGVGLKADAVLRHVNYGEYKLPESSRDIRQIFHDMNGRLLILGKPGSGKTILVLQLAKALLAEAQHDPRKPIPVILNLSSWAAKKLPLEKWIIESMRLAYSVPKKTGENWVKSEQLTLLLDGLDEVAEAVRDECVAAINAYQSAYPRVDLAVCSRIGDYEILPNQLNLNGAIILKDLSEQQIQAYLAGEECQGIRELLANEPETREMAEKPFLLNALKRSYTGIPYIGTPFHQLQLPMSGEKRQNHLLERFVEKNLSQQARLAYPKVILHRYLSWLAWQLRESQQTIFHIEELQPAFLDSSIRRFVYRLVLGLGGALFVAVDVAFLVTAYSSADVGAALGLIVGILYFLLFGFVFALVAEQVGKRIGGLSPIKLVETLSFSISVPSFLISLAVGTVFGILFGLGGSRTISLLATAIITFVLCLRLGLATNDSLSSRSTPNRGFKVSLLNTIGLSLVSAFFVGIVVGLLSGPPTGILFGGFVGLLVFVVFGVPLMQHIVLRLMLIQVDYIPLWRYDRFLDTCAELGFLRKVGGGYIFRHRMLMDYFAEKWEKGQSANE